MFVRIFKGGFTLQIFKRWLGAVHSPKTSSPGAKINFNVLYFLSSNGTSLIMRLVAAPFIRGDRFRKIKFKVLLLNSMVFGAKKILKFTFQNHISKVLPSFFKRVKSNCFSLFMYPIICTISNFQNSGNFEKCWLIFSTFRKNVWSLTIISKKITLHILFISFKSNITSL